MFGAKACACLRRDKRFLAVLLTYMEEPYLGTMHVHAFVAKAGQGALEKQSTYLGEVVASSTNERRGRAVQHPRQGKQQGVVRNLASNNSGLLKVRGAVQAGTNLQHRQTTNQQHQTGHVLDLRVLCYDAWHCCQPPVPAKCGVLRSTYCPVVNQALDVTELEHNGQQGEGEPLQEREQIAPQHMSTWQQRHS